MATKVIAKDSVLLIVLILLVGFSQQVTGRSFPDFAPVRQGISDTIPKEWYGSNAEEFDRPYFKSKSVQAGKDGIVPKEYSDLSERGIFQEGEEEPETPIFYESEVTRIGQRVIPAVAEDYSGFRVQILLAETPLPPDHLIFTRHGSIAVEQLSEGVYAYLVGDFPSEEAAVEFTDVYLAKLYPGLRIVQFEMGKRKF
ncbi:MAG: hypothetical protein HUU01_05695 [Saprospiraceae bacterium]|nr:hypothetical protein [Saprospiraceae bacterium]